MPELASRQHVRDICGVVERALERRRGVDRISARVAVTQGPGPGRLAARRRVVCQVARLGARHAARRRASPRRPHRVAGAAHGELPLPAVVLVVSGGHTSLYLVPSPGAIELLGRTRDDAAGEAYDKVAKLLGLGYPGGPVIDRLARERQRPRLRFRLPADARGSQCAAADGTGGPAARDVERRVDFSFSGLKTAVLRLVQRATGSPPTGTAADADARRGPDPQRGRRHLRQLPARGGRALLDRMFEAARWLGARSVGHRRRRVGEQPAARATRSTRGARARPPGVRAAAVAVDRQRRDDRRRRPAPPARRRRSDWDSTRRRRSRCSDREFDANCSIWRLA